MVNIVRAEDSSWIEIWANGHISGPLKRSQMQTGPAIEFTEHRFLVESASSMEAWCSASRTQKVASPSLAECELRPMVPECSDFFHQGVTCLKLLVGDEVKHWQWTDNQAVRRLASRQGFGKIRRLFGKLLWIHDPTKCTKALSKVGEQCVRTSLKCHQRFQRQRAFRRRAKT